MECVSAHSGLIRLLVVEDSAGLRAEVVRRLHTDGRFEVIEATNGQEGLDLAALHLPDAVLLDLQMPVLSGQDALPALRELLPDAAIVIFTGAENEDEAPALLAAGASAFVIKRTPLRQVFDQIVELVRS